MKIWHVALGLLLVAVAGLLAACGEENDEQPVVLYSVLVSPTDNGGLSLGLMNFRPDIVAAETTGEGKQQLLIGDESGVLAWVTGSRDNLQDERIRVVVYIASSRPFSVLADGFEDLEHTIDGNEVIRLGDQLAPGEHEIVLEGRPAPKERDSEERRRRLLESLSPPEDP